MRTLIKKKDIVYPAFLSGSLLFTAFAGMNPYVRDLDGDYAVKLFPLVYAGGALCLSAFVVELLVSRKFFLRPGVGVVLLLQCYTIFTTILINGDKLGEYEQSHAIKLIVSCVLSFCGFYLGLIHPKRHAVVGRWFMGLAVLFIIAGSLEVLEVGLYSTSRPYSTNLVFPLLLLLALFFSNLSRLELVLVFVVLASLTAISLSRAQIFLCCGIMFFALSKSIGLIRAVSLMLAFGVAFRLMFLDSLPTESFLYFSRVWSLDTTGRTELWRAATTVDANWRDALFGFGVYPIPTEIKIGEIVTTYHNLYLQTFRTLGVVGAMLLSYLLFLLVRGPLNVPRGLVFVVLAAGFTYDLYFIVSYVGRYYEYPLFYFIIGLFLNQGVPRAAASRSRSRNVGRPTPNWDPRVRVCVRNN
ncbi:hypothetical protein [Oricola sp.]|uniref:hypothetical protein n=1 Tax=Oricola sp. TaxID=1979950 RepID=UPI003BA9486F